tara:strand:- start:20514 stop:20903 length:390 start_codon:yes stop_codon:yes gene_type:complete
MMSGSMYDMSGTPDMFQSFIEQNAGRAYETYSDSSEVFGSVNFSIYYAILAAFLALNAILVFSIAFTDKNFKENDVDFSYTVLQNSKVKQHVNKPFGKNLQDLSGEPSSLMKENKGDISPNFANFLKAV